MDQDTAVRRHLLDAEMIQPMSAEQKRMSAGPKDNRSQANMARIQQINDAVTLKQQTLIYGSDGQPMRSQYDEKTS